MKLILEISGAIASALNKKPNCASAAKTPEIATMRDNGKMIIKNSFAVTTAIFISVSCVSSVSPSIEK